MRLVQALGLKKAASEFVQGARADGLEVPSRFGTEVVARLLGLRLNHPAGAGLARAAAAGSGDPRRSRVLGGTDPQLRPARGQRQIAQVKSLADAFALPERQRLAEARSSTTAFSKIGMPYIWGGTSDGTETEFGVSSRGGYDCSGFVWRVYKLQSLRGRGHARLDAPRPHDVPDERRGAPLEADRPREAPARRRASSSATKGPRSKPVAGRPHGRSTSETAGSSSPPADGVALAQLDGWYSRSSPGAGGRCRSRPRALDEADSVVPFQGYSSDGTITPSGDSRSERPHPRISPSGVLVVLPGGTMLEWKSRL